eukprot:m.1537970 g.1537970  ORF g.1537970 m.1537970 type:complete len:116 (-) comp25245_c0_seq43:5880-6227(-)
MCFRVNIRQSAAIACSDAEWNYCQGCTATVAAIVGRCFYCATGAHACDAGLPTRFPSLKHLIETLRKRKHASRTRPTAPLRLGAPVSAAAGTVFALDAWAHPSRPAPALLGSEDA